MHGYRWENSPHPNYTIEGLNAANHGPYCRDALAALLRACPAITGVTLRIHGESGVAEGSYAFWGAVFEGVKRSGRKVEIDMHAKGIDQGMIDLALATGMPVKVSPKFWAEHMGMPYHQADIRDQEMPKAGHRDSGLMALSAGSPQLHPLRLRRPDARGPPLRHSLARLAGHPAPAAVGRPGLRRRLRAGLPVLRIERRRDHGAALL